MARKKGQKPKERPKADPIGPVIVRKVSTGRMTITKYKGWTIRSEGKSVVAVRKTVHVVPKKDDWAIKVGGKTVSVHDTKAEAIDQGKDIAKSVPLGQIVIHKQDGSIQTEHTYGKDPKKYPS